VELKCPVCKIMITWQNNEWRPFCSERCKLIDLGEWADEGYVIGGKEESSENSNTIKEEEQ
jgi:hypothetical protein